MPDWDRRRFLQVGGGVAVGSVVLGLLGRNLLEAAPGRAAEGAALPTAAGAVPDVPAGASLDVAGITPIVVPNDEFYRIDTALVAPARRRRRLARSRSRAWSTARSTLTYDELSAMPLFEQFVTIACVSNEVGGAPRRQRPVDRACDLREVLDMAGVQPEADQIVGRSVDGFTAGFPTAWAMDPERRPMIALGMNGAPLPVDHGYPARLIIPGLYGYVSATKWLSEIELTTWDGLRRLLDPARLGQGGAHPDAVPHRRAPRTARTVDGRRDRRHRRRGLGARPGRRAPSRSPSTTARGSRREMSAPLSDATWVQWKLPWVATGPGGAPHQRACHRRRRASSRPTR